MFPGTHWIWGWVSPRPGLYWRLREIYFALVGNRTPVAQPAVTVLTEGFIKLILINSSCIRLFIIWREFDETNTKPYCSNVAVDWLTFLLLIREVPGSNLGPETVYPE
jgi:hypothetical protein